MLATFAILSLFQGPALFRSKGSLACDVHLQRKVASSLGACYFCYLNNLSGSTKGKPQPLQINGDKILHCYIISHSLVVLSENVSATLGTTHLTTLGVVVWVKFRFVLINAVAALVMLTAVTSI